MAKRSNHYDAAFEELLRQSRIPYVCVDETRRALLRDASLKSMDFIAYAEGQPNLLIDVKGRRYPTGYGETDDRKAGPAGRGHTGHRWENWTEEEDIDCLLKWEQVFGEGFRSLLVFAYHVVVPRDMRDHGRCFRFRGRTYAFYGVWVDEYGDVMRTRSPSWETVSLPAAEFRRLRAPVEQFFGSSSFSCLQPLKAESA